MAKIVIIGAGSLVFASRLTTDILSIPELVDSTIVYVDIDQAVLDLIASFGRQEIAQEKLSATIEADQDRAEALDGADCVISTLRVGGMDDTALDIEIPLKYGLYEAVGDTYGPGGVIYGQCHIVLPVDI